MIEPTSPSVRELRADFARVIDRVADLREQVVVPGGKPAAVLIPVDECDSVEETAEILSDRDTPTAADEGLQEVERGETVSLADVRQELARRRPFLGGSGRSHAAGTARDP